MRRRIEIVAFEHERIIQCSVVTDCPVCFSRTELLTPLQAAALTQVEEERVHQWLAVGKAHGVETPEGEPRICKRSLLLFRQREVKGVVR